jgi:hypothetical protein
MAGNPDDGLAAWADQRRAETRAEQGLSPQVDDPAALAQIAANVGPWLDDQAAGRGQAA